MEKPASQLEPAAMPRPHMRPRLCKHCAASARRRSCADSLCRGLRLGHELLETRIFAERIPEWIETKIGGGDSAGNFEEMRNRCYRRIEITETCLNLRESGFCVGFCHSIIAVIGNRTLCLFQGFLPV